MHWHYTYPLGLYKPSLGWRWYRDANPVPTSSLTDGIATAILVPVLWLAARDILHVQSHRQGSTHQGMCCTDWDILHVQSHRQGSTHHGLCCTGWDILHAQSHRQGSTHHGLCCTDWDILHVQSNTQGSTHHGLCCTGGIFYMYNQTHRVAHTTDCAALVEYFTCTIKHTG